MKLSNIWFLVFKQQSVGPSKWKRDFPGIPWKIFQRRHKSKQIEYYGYLESISHPRTSRSQLHLETGEKSVEKSIKQYLKKKILNLWKHLMQHWMRKRWASILVCLIWGRCRGDLKRKDLKRQRFRTWEEEKRKKNNMQYGES